MTSATLEQTSVVERALAERALAGDHDAFGELFALHERGLVNLAYRLTGSREDAADIAQEAFLRVFARLDTLAARPDVNLSAYLFRTARNLVYDHGTRTGREVLQDDLERSAGSDDAPGSDPALAPLVDAQVAEVRAANARLPERYRLVLSLRELEGMSYAQIAQVLGVTEAAAGQAIVRARMALRRELRLEQVDEDALPPEVRERLRDICADIDGELSGDAKAELDRFLAGDAQARRVRAALEEAGERYRAWLPFPALLLGDQVARAAEARGLLAPRPVAPPSRLARARRSAGDLTRRPRIGRTAVLAGAILLLLATAAFTARVGPDADPEPQVAAPLVTTTQGTTRATPATTARAASTEAAPAPVPRAPARSAAAGAARPGAAQDPAAPASAPSAPAATTTRSPSPSGATTTRATPPPAAATTPSAPTPATPDPAPQVAPEPPAAPEPAAPEPVQPAGDPTPPTDPGRDPQPPARPDPNDPPTTPPGTTQPDPTPPPDPGPGRPSGPGGLLAP